MEARSRFHSDDRLGHAARGPPGGSRRTPPAKASRAWQGTQPAPGHSSSTPQLPAAGGSAHAATTVKQGHADSSASLWADTGPLLGTDASKGRSDSRPATRGTSSRHGSRRPDPEHVSRSSAHSSEGSRGKGGRPTTAGGPGWSDDDAAHPARSGSGLSPTAMHSDLLVQEDPPRQGSLKGRRSGAMSALHTPIRARKGRGKKKPARKRPASAALRQHSAHRRRPSQQRMQTSASVAGMRPGTRSSTSSLRSAAMPGSVAGYVPPTDASRVDQRRLAQARDLLQTEEGLESMKGDPLFRLAALQVGVVPADVKSCEGESLEQYRRGPGTPRTTLQLRQKHVLRHRAMTLALVLSQMDIAAEEHAVSQMAAGAVSTSIQADLHRHLEAEAEAIKRAEVTREHQQRVLQAEMQANQERRAAWDAQVAAEREKAAAKADEEATAARVKLMVQAAREQQRDAVRQRQLQMEDEKAAAALAAAEEERAQDAARRERKEEEKRMRRFIADYRRQRREGNRAAADSEHERRLAELQQRMQHKEEVLSRQRQRLAEEAAQRDAAKWARDQQRRANATRIAREREYRQELVAQQYAARMQRMEVLRSMQDAFAHERAERQAAERIKADALKKEARAKRTLPGPGEYVLPSFTDTLAKGRGKGVGKWGAPRRGRLAELHSAAAASRDLPGPGTYVVNEALLRPAPKLAVISGSKPKGHLEQSEAAARSTPGPGEYSPPPARVTQRGGPRGVVIGSSSSSSYLDSLAKTAALTPGPGGSLLTSPVLGRSKSRASMRSLGRPPSVKSLRKAVESGQAFAPPPTSLGGGVVSTAELEPLLATALGSSASAPAFTPVMRGRQAHQPVQEGPSVAPPGDSEHSRDLSQAEAAAATRIQAAARGRATRKQVAGQSKAEAAAATRIQAAARGRATRKQVASQSKAEAAAATRIQAAARGRATRKQVASQSKAEAAASVEGRAAEPQAARASAEEHAAASKVQAVVRGRQGRAEAVRRREEREWGGLRY